jgi:HD superfamily phosphodiesterase
MESYQQILPIGSTTHLGMKSIHLPDRESGDYKKYLKALCNIDAEVKLFKGFYQPPMEEEYHRLVEEDTQRRRAERLLDEYEARGEPDSESDESDEGYSSEEW